MADHDYDFIRGDKRRYSDDNERDQRDYRARDAGVWYGDRRGGRDDRGRYDDYRSSRGYHGHGRYPERGRDRRYSGGGRGRERDGYRGRDYYRGERDRQDDRASSRSSQHRQDRPQGGRERAPPPPPGPPPSGEVEEGEISATPLIPARPQATSAAAAPAPAEPAKDPNRSPSPELELELESFDEPDPLKLLEERKRKREAIMAKAAALEAAQRDKASPAPSTPAAGPPALLPALPATATAPFTASPTPALTPAFPLKTAPASPTLSASSAQNNPDFTISLGKEMTPAPAAQAAGEEVSAADYDDRADRRADEARERVRLQMDVVEGGGKGTEVVEVEDEGEDEDDDDEDDMFAISDEPGKAKRRKTTHIAPATVAMPIDGSTDSEGYYAHTLGEVLDNGRYTIFASLGRGMFSSVVRVRDAQQDNREFAIKIIRSQESMYKAGQKEAILLNKLAALDPEDKKHLVRLERTFEHRGHLCLVFESLGMNLRDIIKRFGANVGLNIRAVRAYAHQMFLGLSLLRKANVMHADLKPDNILVSENKAVLKLCDLGSASDVTENEITPYLVSRFYRAPEIILGLPYDPALDMWSIGCTLYELYTGKILFPGRNNNHMLLLMMELKGKFNHRMIKKARFGASEGGHFAENCDFISIEKDKLTGQDVPKVVPISTRPVRDIRARLLPGSTANKMKDDELRAVTHFVDLLDKCLALDPAKRLTPREALAHPFLHG